MDPAWARQLRDLALATGTAFFFKQWGGRIPKAGGRELDGRTWDEYPKPVSGPVSRVPFAKPDVRSSAGHPRRAPRAILAQT